MWSDHPTVTSHTSSGTSWFHSYEDSSHVPGLRLTLNLALSKNGVLTSEHLTGAQRGALSSCAPKSLPS